jgi:hypothetical protein
MRLPSYASSGNTAKNCNNASGDFSLEPHAATTSAITVFQLFIRKPSAAIEMQI